MFLSLTVLSLIMSDLPISHMDLIMPSVTIFEVTNGTATTTGSTYTSSDNNGNAVKYLEDDVAKPYNGKKSLTHTVLDNKRSGLRNRVVSYNLPRLTAPVGTNPATGLPFVPSVINSITVKVSVIAPNDVSDAEIKDSLIEMSTYMVYGAGLAHLQGK